MQEFGYDKDRFPNITGDQFDCIICSQIAKLPQECSGCGNIFCSACIASWKQKSQDCPNRCASTNKISPCSKALLKMYNNLDINCLYYDKCKKIVKLCDLEQHEKICQIPQCKNNEICKSIAKKNTNFCDNPPCKLIIQMKGSGNNYKQMLGEISTFLGQYHKQPQFVQQILKNPQQGGNHYCRWSNQNKGTGIELSDSNLRVWLKESAYAFRTVITDIPYQNGQHYFEIIADERTENELKIGVVTKQDFQYNSCFCDFEYGFAFYGLGQLRHNSNASGAQYGKRFKKEGILGCFLNMDKGQLSFALNGEFLGVAFQSEALKKGPIYAAVALTHCAGCSINSSKIVPNYFQI